MVRRINRRAGAIDTGLLRRPGTRFTVGGGVPAWTPADATSATLRAWIVFDQDNLTLDGSLINGVTDLSGTGNDLAALALDTTRPTFDADGFLGKGCAVFDGVNDALAKAGFSWGGTGYGTIAWFGQTDENVASDAIWGYNGARPFVRTSSNGGLAAQVTTNGTPTVSTTKSSYGPTCHISRWDGSGTDFVVFVDGVSETPALATGSPPADNLRMGLGYDGAATPNRHHKCRVRAFVAYRGALSDDETQLLNAYMRSLAPLPTVGPVELIWAGQSNAMAEGLTLFPRLVQRRNINAARDNTKASGPVREQTPWGPIDDAYLVTSLRSIGIEAMVQLNEERGISGHLLNSAYTGAGFRVGDGSTVDRWIPPSRNSGTGGEAYDRLITLVNDTRTNEPAGTARSRTWFLWCHGETDALNSTGAGDYEDNLSALIDDYIADTGDTDLRIAIVQLPSGYDGGSDPADRATIRAAQAAVVAAKADAYLIDVDAFALQPDDVHYSQAMAIEIATQLCDLISTDLGVPLPPAPPWSPSDLSSLTLWFDENDITGSPVSQWDDQAGVVGSGAYFAQSTGANQPATGTINGLAAVDFTSPSYMIGQKLAGPTNLVLSDVITASAYHVLIVAEVTSVPAGATSTIGYQLPAIVYDTLGYFYPINFRYIDATTVEVRGGHWAGSNVTVSAGNLPALNQPVLLEAWYDGTNFSIQVDGNSPGSGAAGNITSLTNRFDIGRNYTAGHYFDGLVGEILVCNAALSAGDRASARTYLANKYGITI